MPSSRRLTFLRFRPLVSRVHTSLASLMNVSQPSRRQAAVKACAQLVDISSDEDNNERDSGEECGRTELVKGKIAKSGRSGKGKGRTRGISNTNTEHREGKTATKHNGKRKRGGSDNLSLLRKRRRSVSSTVAHHEVVIDDGDSDLTPLSTDNELEETITLPQRQKADFPMETSVPPDLGSRKKNQKFDGPATFPFPELFGLDQSSEDELPDIGQLISRTYDKTPKNRTKAKGRSKHTRNDTISSTLSSPTLPPPSSLSHAFTDDDITEVALSDRMSPMGYDNYFDLDELDDETYQDELCLAKSKANQNVYWPAKILEVKNVDVNTKGKGKELQKRFRVLFLDRTETDIPRDWFYISSQDEFGTCKLGAFESSHVEHVNDIDEERNISQTKTKARTSKQPGPSSRSSQSRSPSPDLSLSPLVVGPEYCDLPMRHQFAYVKPVLTAIMNEKYTWGLRRHSMFTKGGATRAQLTKEGGMKGSLDARAVAELLNVVQRWSLGSELGKTSGDQYGNSGKGEVIHLAANGLVAVERPSEQVEPVHENPSNLDAAKIDQVPSFENGTREDLRNEFGKSGDERMDPISLQLSNPDTNAAILPPKSNPATSEGVAGSNAFISPNLKPGDTNRHRQTGSLAYEKLSLLDKNQYCVEVLLPEAIIQILLWRASERKSLEVLWDNSAEEERLYRRGQELLSETDWVLDVMRLRRRLEEKAKRLKEASDKRKGKNEELRKTRSGRIGKVGSYRE